mmetsp:Transcript_36941/g.88258  ORF Transcript_36941/g.88258 Transcript_36941/m.88258 type:complete len:308 (+) Transcript_36941:474-1397(+)
MIGGAGGLEPDSCLELDRLDGRGKRQAGRTTSTQAWWLVGSGKDRLQLLKGVLPRLRKRRFNAICPIDTDLASEGSLAGSDGHLAGVGLQAMSPGQRGVGVGVRGHQGGVVLGPGQGREGRLFRLVHVQLHGLRGLGQLLRQLLGFLAQGHAVLGLAHHRRLVLLTVAVNVILDRLAVERRGRRCLLLPLGMVHAHHLLALPVNGFVMLLIQLVHESYLLVCEVGSRHLVQQVVHGGLQVLGALQCDASGFRNAGSVLVLEVRHEVMCQAVGVVMEHHSGLCMELQLVGHTVHLHRVGLQQVGAVRM